MRSCGRGRDSATPECFGRGSQGTIFVRSSRLSLFFPELCSFRRVFVSRAFVKFGAKRSSPGAFGFDDVLELFLKTAPGHQAFSCELRLRPRVFFENFYYFFKAEPVLLAWQLWWSPGWAKLFGGGSSKTRMETWFSALARSSAEGPPIVVAFSTSRLRWSMVQKRQKSDEVSLWLPFIVCKTSEETSEFWGACFRHPMSPFCYSLFSCMWLYRSTLVRMQIGDSEEKQSSVTLPVLITEP